jgi:hypothetical protein
LHQSVEPVTYATRNRYNYAKNKLPLKSKIEALRVQLTALATADESQTGATATKIDELLATKREMLLAKYAHIADQRALLTPEQQVPFDMDVIHQAMHGERGACEYGRGH